MKVKVNKPTVVDVQYLEVILNVDYLYPEDWQYNSEDIDFKDLPFYVEETNELVFFIDLSTGYILDWDDWNKLEVMAKVRDEGEYYLCDKYLNKVLKSEGRYVPKMLDTRGDGGGDYLQFEVNASGAIINWKVNFDKFDVECLS